MFNLNIEFLAIKLIFHSKTFYITCSYIPPQSEDHIYFEHSRVISYISTLLSDHDHLIITGDFFLGNYPNVGYTK